MPGLNTQGLLRLLSPASISRTLRLWSRFANRPATTQPQLPPPHTMMSNSSGRTPRLFAYELGVAMMKKLQLLKLLDFLITGRALQLIYNMYRVCISIFTVYQMPNDARR